MVISHTIYVTHRRPRRSRAVTFLELMIVLVILGIVLAVSLPSLKTTYQRGQLSSAAREIVALLRVARAEAIFREHPIEVRFDLAGDRYRLDLLEPDTDKHHRYNEPRISEIEQIRYLPRDVSFAEISTEAEATDKPNVAKVVFFPNGSATGASIILENVRGRKMKIELAHATALTEAEFLRTAKVPAESAEAQGASDAVAPKESAAAKRSYR
jgi:type II secretion system protein H